MPEDALEAKITQYLKAKIANGICLAFSGGVDSALLLHFLAACQKNNAGVLAVTFDTELFPYEDIEFARSFSALYNFKHVVLPVNVLSDKKLRYNPVDRCYHCKSMLFAQLKYLADQERLSCIMDGTNATDLGQYRPGIKALQEQGICSPWAELGITKAQIRQLAQKLALPVAARPSAPCIATRFPYGAELDTKVIEKLISGEKLLKALDITTVRLRYYSGLVRIEVMEQDFNLLLKHKTTVDRKSTRLNSSH